MRQEHSTCDSKDEELGWGILSKQDSMSLSGEKDLIFLLTECDQCTWRQGQGQGRVSCGQRGLELGHVGAQMR